MSIISRKSQDKPTDICFRLRVLNATYQRNNMALIQTNDDNTYGVFSKTFEHDINGLLTNNGQQNYDKLLKALSSGSQNDFNNIVLSNRKLVDPQASLFIPLIGVDTSVIPSFTPPKLDSTEHMIEMFELYAMELSRDIPFTNYSTDSTISSIINKLNNPDILNHYNGPLISGQITYNTIFKGKNFTGPYISQFLYYPIPIPGMDSLEQKYLSPKIRANGGIDFGVDINDAVSIRNGNIIANNNSRFESDKRYIYNGRVLAEVVHNDDLYQFYYNTVSILKYLGCPRNAAWNISNNQLSFPTFGGDADILANLGEVSGLALKHAWYHKWQIHRRLRPEETGILIDRQFNNIVDIFDSNLLANDIFNDISTLHQNIYNKSNSYVLSSCYPEGCPAHPAYPAGHATIAGAAITLIKCYYNCGGKWIDLPKLENYGLNRLYKTAEANEDGTELVEVPNNPNMTINEELNKLAYNIALGRDWANVHYRSDGDMGLLLGEEVAINYMRDVLTQYNQTHTSDVEIEIERINGTKYIIQPTLK
jgi:hypothetical protein